jgi:uncharacterized protein YabE (DUF348 family)
MNSLIRKSATPFGALVVAVIFLITMAVVAISSVTHADNGATPQRGRLITIHDGGAEKVIISQSTTVGDAIKEAGITIDSKDMVEPAVTEKLVASDYQVNIYRARPVIIVDGNVRQKIITPYQTAEQIAASVGITLYPEDKTTIDRVDNLTEGVGLQLTIIRATPFVFDLYGNTTTVRTQGTTVGEMLSEKGIKLGKDDRVLPSSDTKLTEGLAVRVWREGKQTITVDEPINFDVQKIEDVDQPISYQVIKTPGENGTRNVTYEVTIQDGQEVGRTEIASITTKPATDQIEVVGVKGKYTTPSENENITWDFLISNGFSSIQVAGIMGNLMQEHGFNTSDSSGGYGIAQWTGSRRAALLSLPGPDNIYTQLGFLMAEMNAKGLTNTIKNTNYLSSSVDIFQNQFERCGVCMEGNRLTYAQNILASH